MTTDRDRALARKCAEAIYKFHVAKGHAYDAHHIATNISYQEALYRGLLAEIDFAHMFGLAINDELLADGDGGRDFSLALCVHGRIIRLPVDIKTTTMRSPDHWDALLRTGNHLRVPTGAINASTIYVYGAYYEHIDAAEVLRWEWGRVLISENNRKVFKNSNGTENYVKRFESLRDLRELRERQSMEGICSQTNRRPGAKAK